MVLAAAQIHGAGHSSIILEQPWQGCLCHIQYIQGHHDWHCWPINRSKEGNRDHPEDKVGFSCEGSLL